MRGTHTNKHVHKVNELSCVFYFNKKMASNINSKTKPSLLYWNGSKLTHSAWIAWPALIHLYLLICSLSLSFTRISFNTPRMNSWNDGFGLHCAGFSQLIWHPDCIQFHNLLMFRIPAFQMENLKCKSF